MRPSIPAAIFCGLALAVLFGTPHYLVETECQFAFGRCTQMIVACTYVGIQGRRMVVPKLRIDPPPSCPVVAWLPLMLASPPAQ